MLFLYNLLTLIAWPILQLAALFSPKMKLFTAGRKDVFKALSEKLVTGDKVIWFHSASLGEYEQGLPVMERIRQLYPQHKIVLTFFSPSGYEIRKNTKAADIVVYLPLDTKPNAKKFIKLVLPEMVFFIKYEFWPNYLKELKRHNITTYLISGIFREKQAFFKWYGGFYREALKTFEHFFVQNESSKSLLHKIGFRNVTISGDTRYDRVSEILQRDNKLPFIEEFTDGKKTVVYGSSWPKDEAIFRQFISLTIGHGWGIKHIVAPHDTGKEHITKLVKEFGPLNAVLFSEKEGKNLADYDIFIIDTIGILSKIYSYADIAYVGGGFGTAGLHNILEPAAFGVPIVIGPNHEKFPEAAAMIHFGGCLEGKSEEDIRQILFDLVRNDDYCHEAGHKAGTFITMNSGAVDIILGYIKNNSL